MSSALCRGGSSRHRRSTAPRPCKTHRGWQAAKGRHGRCIAKGEGCRGAVDDGAWDARLRGGWRCMDGREAAGRRRYGTYEEQAQKIRAKKQQSSKEQQQQEDAASAATAAPAVQAAIRWVSEPNDFSPARRSGGRRRAPRALDPL